MLLTHHTDTLNTYLVDATHDSVLMLGYRVPVVIDQACV